MCTALVFTKISEQLACTFLGRRRRQELRRVGNERNISIANRALLCAVLHEAKYYIYCTSELGLLCCLLARKARAKAVCYDRIFILNSFKSIQKIITRKGRKGQWRNEKGRVRGYFWGANLRRNSYMLVR